MQIIFYLFENLCDFGTILYVYIVYCLTAVYGVYCLRQFIKTATLPGRCLGSPTGANVVHPVGRAEAGVACRFSEAVSTAAHSLPNATAKLQKKMHIHKYVLIFSHFFRMTCSIARFRISHIGACGRCRHTCRGAITSGAPWG